MSDGELLRLGLIRVEDGPFLAPPTAPISADPRSSPRKVCSRRMNMSRRVLRILSSI